MTNGKLSLESKACLACGSLRVVLDTSADEEIRAAIVGGELTIEVWQLQDRIVLTAGVVALERLAALVGKRIA